jgi:hypothetical protein
MALRHFEAIMKNELSSHVRIATTAWIAVQFVVAPEGPDTVTSFRELR